MCDDVLKEIRLCWDVREQLLVGWIPLFIYLLLSKGQHLGSSVCREMHTMNSSTGVWRTLPWKETDAFLSLESCHLLSAHVLQECSSVSLTVPLPTDLVPGWGCWLGVYSPISAHQLADGKPHVCALRAFNKHERVWLAVGEHHICFGLSIYCWWQPISLISCTIFNGTAN